MSNDKWEKRAHELIGEVVKNRGLVGTDWQNAEVWEGACVSWALQLGREMAAEASRTARDEAWLQEARLELQRMAADARAEEIAQKIESCNCGSWSAAHAQIARSFISKPKSREQVLEEALRYIEQGAEKQKMPDGAGWVSAVWTTEACRRALEWKP